MSPLRIIGDAYYSYSNQLASDNSSNLAEQYAAQYVSDPDVASVISANVRRYNFLTPGSALALGQAKAGPDTGIAAEVARSVAKRKASTGIGWHTFGEVLNTVVPPIGHLIGYVAEPATSAARTGLRYGFTALSAGKQSLDALAANTAKQVHDKGVLGGLYSGLVTPEIHASETTLGQHLLNGKSLGSGYFPSNTPANQAADEAQRNVYQIDGHHATMGQIAAHIVAEPGTLPYQLLSTAVDAFGATKLDPINRGMVGHSRNVKAAETLSEKTRSVPSVRTLLARETASAGATPEERAAAGLVDNSYRVTVDDNAALDFAMDTKRGNRFISDVTTLDSPYAIWKKYPGTDVQSARALSETRTDPESLHVFSERYLTGSLSKTPKRGIHIRPDAESQIRLLQGTIPRNNLGIFSLGPDGTPYLDQVAHLMEAHLVNAKMSNKAIAQHFDRLSYVTSFEEMKVVLDDAMLDASLRVAGAVDPYGNIAGKGALRVGDKVYLGDNPRSGEVVHLYDSDSVAKVHDADMPRGVSTDVPYTQQMARVRTHDGTLETFHDIPVESLSYHAPISWVRKAFLRTQRLTEDLRDDMTAELADDIPRTTMMSADGPVDLGTAYPRAEALNATYAFPDMREIRRLTSAYGRILNSTPLGVLPDVGDGFHKIWRPLRLASIASGLRAFSEDQMRLAASGGTNLIGNPIRTLNLILNRSGDVDNLLQHSDELQTVLAHAGGGWLDNGVKKFSQVIHAHDPRFPAAHADRIVALARDPLAQRLVGNPIADVKAWFWDTEIPRLKALQPNARTPAHFKNRGAADKYVDDIMTHVEHLTKGDSKLLSAIASGTVGEPIDDPLYTLPIFRRDAAAANLTPSSRPHGTYYSIADEEGFVSHHMDEGDTSFLRRGLNESSPQVLNLDQGEWVSHARFGPAGRGPIDAGVAALRHLTSPDEFERLRKASKADLITELAAKFPGGDYGKYHDAYELLGAYGAQLARKGGFKAIALRTKDKGWSEFVALADDAVRDIPKAPAAYRSTATGFAPTDDLLTHTRALAQTPDSTPHVTIPRDASPHTKARGKAAVDGIFNLLYTVPFKTLTASPAVKDWYWERLSQLMPMLSRDAQEYAVNFARDANQPRSYLRTLASSMLSSNGDLMFHEAHGASKIWAADKAKSLFYDLHDKSQFGDVIRHFSPFFEVWRDTLKTWPKLIAKNPATLRKFQLTVQGARGSGFFSQDENGEEVWTMPGSAFVSKHLTNGIPVPLTGSAKSLNLVLSGSTPLLPSVGPIVQIPLSKILPNVPDTDWLRKTIFPYGEGQANLAGALAPPGWFTTIATGLNLNPNKQRDMAIATQNAMSSLMSTGEYDPSDPVSMRALEDKAYKLAKTIYYFRGVAQLISPASPRPQWQSKGAPPEQEALAYAKSIGVDPQTDPNGGWLSQAMMASTFHELEKKMDYDDAATAFLKVYGIDNLLLLQPHTEGQSTDNKATYDWMRLNPELASQYPDAYQYFAPRSGERAPYEAYMSALDTGQRRVLSNQDWIKRANDRVASMIYYNVKSLIGPKPAKNQTEYLRGLKTFLTSKYPGFDPESTDPKRRQRTIDQLYTAAKDPTVLSSTDAGRGIAIYLSARDAAIESAGRAKIIGWQSAKSTRSIRAWLREVAGKIIDQHPEFERVWEKVFSGEMVDD